MKIIGYCVLESKEYVMFEDNHCGDAEFKLTDGFHDKVMNWNSKRMIGIRTLSKEEINLEKIVKRMRGARKWHPLLALLREEVKKSE
ncbi:MAG: hypothetical protein Q4C77_03815 [Eubacteriales bacterium]|nr:hypothetical protein [Eubacteriales bacterium]